MFIRYQMERILRFIRLSGLALLLAAVQVSCDRTDPYADNAFRNALARLDWGAYTSSRTNNET